MDLDRARTALVSIVMFRAVAGVVGLLAGPHARSRRRMLVESTK